MFRNRLAAQTHAAGIELLAVNPAYSSIWGDAHWRKPYENVTRHQAAATVIGRRAQGHSGPPKGGGTATTSPDNNPPLMPFPSYRRDVALASIPFT